MNLGKSSNGSARSQRVARWLVAWAFIGGMVCPRDRLVAADPLPPASLTFNLLPNSPWLYEGLPVHLVVNSFDPEGVFERVEFFVDGVNVGTSYRCPVCPPGHGCPAVVCPPPPLGFSVGHSLDVGPLAVGNHQAVAVGYSLSGLVLTTPPFALQIRPRSEIPVVTVDVTDAEASEQGDLKSRVARFQIQRSGGDIGKPLAVSFQFTGSATHLTDFRVVPSSGGNPGDPSGQFPGTPSQVILPADQASIEVMIEALGDEILEGDENLRLELVPSHSVVVPGISGIYDVGTKASGRAVIRDGAFHTTAQGAVSVAFIEALRPDAGSVRSNVVVHVYPLPQTTSWRVEVPVPDSVSIVEATEGGVVDSARHRLVWGPFFDAQPRHLIARTGRELPAEIGGQLTVDGVVKPLEVRCWDAEGEGIRIVEIRRLPTRIVQVLVEDLGGGGAVDLESSRDGREWQSVVVSAQGEGVSWHWEFEPSGDGFRFYRARKGSPVAAPRQSATR